MKKMIKYLILGFGIMLLFTYAIGLFDDAFKKVYQVDTLYEGVVASFKYYFLWVLPYWWLAILIGALILGLIFYAVGEGIKLFKKN